MSNHSRNKHFIEKHQVNSTTIPLPLMMFFLLSSISFSLFIKWSLLVGERVFFNSLCVMEGVLNDGSNVNFFFKWLVTQLVKSIRPFIWDPVFEFLSYNLDEFSINYSIICIKKKCELFLLLYPLNIFYGWSSKPNRSIYDSAIMLLITGVFFWEFFIKQVKHLDLKFC